MKFITDLIILLIISYYISRGWRRGFTRTILLPLCLILSVTAAFALYRYSGEIIPPLLISLIGPFVLRIIFSILLKVWNKTVDDNEPLSLISQTTGALISGTSSIVMLTTFLILLVNILLFRSPSDPIRDNITNSLSYQGITLLFGKTLSPIDLLEDINHKLKNPEIQSQLQSSKEYKDLMEDSAFQDLLNDKETLQILDDGNLAELLTDEQLINTLRNEDILQKILALHKVLLKLDASEPSKPERTPPKVIILK